MNALFQAKDLTAQYVTDADVELFQPLLEHCEEFFRLIYGRPATPDEARRMPQERPPGAPGHLVALRDADGRLVGIMEGIRHYPAPDEWYLGLMLLAPEVRGHGRGEAVIRGYEGWVRSEGAKVLRLGVAEQNAAGLRFWRRMGFEDEKWVGPLQQGDLTYLLLRMRKSLA